VSVPHASIIIMSRRIEIPLGTRFGRLVTRAPGYVPAGAREVHFDCRCDCGTLCVILSASLRRGNTQSCGCLHRERISGPKPGRGLRGELSPHWKGADGKASKFAWLADEKSQPCTDCGQCFNPVAMQFDHVPARGVKLFMIGQTACGSRRTLAELKAERAKCDLVCANCHAIRTSERHRLARGAA
jgi:hypothetical protein